MLTTSNAARLAAGCTRFNIPAPKAARDAEALHTACDALRASIRAEAPPDLDALTPANVKATHEALVAFANRDARLTAADAIVNRAEFARALAWHQAVPALTEAFRAPYTSAASRFTAALAALDNHTGAEWAIDNGKPNEHADLTDAADELSELALIREALATVTDSGILPREVDKLTRVLTIPDHDTALRRIPVRSEGHPTYSLGWWATLAQLEGVALEWHDVEQQRALAASLPAERRRERVA